MIYELKELGKAAPLFGQWQESLIWSCLQGVMGKIYVDSLEKPASALALLGDFGFFAGRPDREMVLGKPESREKDFVIMVPQDKAWEELMEECLGERAKKVTRYAIKKEPGVFCREKLKAAAEGVPQGYDLRLMDESLFWQCREIGWCRDWVAQYEDYGQYKRYGLGAVLRLPGRDRDRDCNQGGFPKEGPCLYLRGKADPGMPGSGLVSQLGCPE